MPSKSLNSRNRSEKCRRANPAPEFFARRTTDWECYTWPRARWAGAGGVSALIMTATSSRRNRHDQQPQTFLRHPSLDRASPDPPEPRGAPPRALTSRAERPVIPQADRFIRATAIAGSRFARAAPGLKQSVATPELHHGCL